MDARTHRFAPSTHQVSSPCDGQVYIHWVYTTLLARVPPTEILPGCLAGTMDHALSREWLHQNKITYVLCLFGDTQLHLVEPFRYENCLYLNWSINFLPHFQKIVEVYKSMKKILSQDSNRLLVHSRNGKDRTALAIFGYLMINEHDRYSALQKLEARKGTDGLPIMNVFRNPNYRNFEKMFEPWLFSAAIL